MKRSDTKHQPRPRGAWYEADFVLSSSEDLHMPTIHSETRCPSSHCPPCTSAPSRKKLRWHPPPFSEGWLMSPGRSSTENIQARERFTVSHAPGHLLGRQPIPVEPGPACSSDGLRSHTRTAACSLSTRLSPQPQNPQGRKGWLGPLTEVS